MILQCKPKPIGVIGVMIGLLCMAFNAWSQQERGSQRTLEISSRIGRAIYTVEFFDRNGSALDKSTQFHVYGERFAWTRIPETAGYFRLSNLDGESEKKPVMEGQNTYVRLFDAPGNLATKTKGGGIFQLESEAKELVAPNTGGKWLYVGKLDSNEDDAEWKSLYFRDASGDHLDRRRKFTFTDLKAKANEGALFTLDFPLYLRSAPNSRAEGDPILRAGQKIQVEKLEKRDGSNVWARVVVKQ